MTLFFLIFRMRWIKAMFWLGLSLAFFHFLNYPMNIGANRVPALGSFLSPYTGFWQLAEPAEWKPEGELKLSGLGEDVEVIFDDRMIPHIYAQSEEDLLRAQGYVHAMFRLWQMDFITRVAAGRVSEIVGERAIDFDRRTRRKGLPSAAEKAATCWSEFKDIKPLLDAYCEGVNAYISQLDPRKLPLEYQLLGYKPEEWSILKSAYFFKYMSNVLASKNADLSLTNARAFWGEELFGLLYPEEPLFDDPVIPNGTPWDFEPIKLPSADAIQDPMPLLKGLLPDDFPRYEGLGSNNWAVSGRRSTTGLPILCNDPHLPLNLPSIWFENHLHCPTLHAYGVSFPGIMGVIIGHNDSIAWGVTNSGIDVVDWYKIEENGDNKYLIDHDTEASFDIDIDTIFVKDANPVIDSIHWTEWGPMPFKGMEHPLRDFAMKWVVHDCPDSKDLLTFFNLNKAQNLTDYYVAIQEFASPIQNFIYADANDNIAITVQGLIPIRQKGKGRFLNHSLDTTAQWYGMVPAEQTPRVVNPQRGFVSSANQQSASDEYPYPLVGGDWYEYRGKRINDLLRADANVSPSDMKKYQYDSYTAIAEMCLPILLEILEKHRPEVNNEWHFKILIGWHYQYESRVKAAVLYENFWNEVYRLVWDELDEHSYDFEIKYPTEWVTIKLIDSLPDHPLFDIKNTDNRESAVDLISAAYDQIKLDFKQDRMPEWSRYRASEIPHMLQISALSYTDIVSSGNKNAINALRKDVGPSWRMIVELGQEVKSQGHYPGGQSGNPGSHYYDNFVEDWAAGVYYPFHFHPDPGQMESFTKSKIKFNK